MRRAADNLSERLQTRKPCAFNGHTLDALDAADLIRETFRCLGEGFVAARAGRNNESRWERVSGAEPGNIVFTLRANTYFTIKRGEKFAIESRGLAQLRERLLKDGQILSYKAEPAAEAGEDDEAAPAPIRHSAPCSSTSERPARCASAALARPRRTASAAAIASGLPP